MIASKPRARRRSTEIVESRRALQPHPGRAETTGMPRTSMPRGTQVVFEQLKIAAAAPRLVSYSELMDAAGLPARAAGTRLDYIHAKLSEKSARLPCLVAIAVSKSTGVPSGGLFRNEGFKLDLKKPSHRVWWRAMVLHVFATDWSGVEL